MKDRRPSTLLCLQAFKTTGSDNSLKASIIQRKKTEPFITYNSENKEADYINFRTLFNILKDVGIEEDIWVSLSGSPNTKGWECIAEEIKKKTGNNIAKIIDFDLQQESHAELNGCAITHTTQYNWVNKGMNAAQVLTTEESWLRSLREQASLNLMTIKEYKNEIYKLDDFEYHHIQQPFIIRSENEIVTELGFEYHRFAVSDHIAPSDEDIDSLIDCISTLKKGDWLHIHCKHGQGRSSTIAAMYLMLKYADKISFDTIVEKIAELPPTFFKLNPDGKKENEYSHHRHEKFSMLKEFHTFSQDRLNGYSNTWSAWKEEKKCSSMRRRY